MNQSQTPNNYSIIIFSIMEYIIDLLFFTKICSKLMHIFTPHDIN
jgi:hypothetical protein